MKNLKVYFTGNGSAQKIDSMGDFDTSTIEGQTYHNNCTSMSWDAFQSQAGHLKVNQITTMLDRIVNSDSSSIDADKLFSELQAIEEQEWFNGYNYPIDFVDRLTAWAKQILIKAQS